MGARQREPTTNYLDTAKLRRHNRQKRTINATCNRDSATFKRLPWQSDPLVAERREQRLPKGKPAGRLLAMDATFGTTSDNWGYGSNS
jgi:hypothetical protein